LTVDLDHFKEANDLFGHVIGDELLCAISRRLQHAADDAFIARVGGDEFTLILAAGDQPKAAQALANRLLGAVAKPFEVRGQQIPIGLSVGGTIYPEDATDINALIANADAALARAKADGGHMVRFFEPEMDRRLRERYELQRDMRSAIAHGEFVLHYQPQAKIDGEVFGFEALLRLVSSDARPGAAEHFHPARRTERHDRRDRRMDAAPGLRRSCLVAEAVANRRQSVPRPVP
jgi:diguanylate cyclase (GGDEF)-like protein